MASKCCKRSDPIISARDATTARCCFFFVGYCSVNAQSIIFLLSHSSAGGVQEMWADLAEGFRTRGFDVRLMALYPYLEAAPTRAGHPPWTYVVARRPTKIGEKLGLCDLSASIQIRAVGSCVYGDAGSKRAGSPRRAHGRCDDADCRLTPFAGPNLPPVVERCR